MRARSLRFIADHSPVVKTAGHRAHWLARHPERQRTEDKRLTTQATQQGVEVYAVCSRSRTCAGKSRPAAKRGAFDDLAAISRSCGPRP